MRAREAEQAHLRRIAFRALGQDAEQPRFWESQVIQIGQEGALFRLPVDVDEAEALEDAGGSPFFTYSASPWFGDELML